VAEPVVRENPHHTMEKRKIALKLLIRCYCMEDQEKYKLMDGKRLKA
jgi:hypothetical protein